MAYIPSRLWKACQYRIRPDIASKVIPGFPWSREAWMRWKEYRDARAREEIFCA